MARPKGEDVPRVAVDRVDWERFGLVERPNGDVVLGRPQEMFRCERCGRIAPRYGKQGAQHARKCGGKRG